MRPLTFVLGAIGVGVLAVPLLASMARADEPYRSGYIPARDMTDAEARRALDAFQAAGQLAYRPSADKGFVDLGTSLDGVQFQYRGQPLPISHVTPQFAVLLTRLSQVARRTFNAVALQHAGIYPGLGPKNDVHNRGSAIDLTGLLTLDEGPIQVLADWGNRPKRGPGYRLTPDDRGYGVFAALYDFAAREAEDDPGGDRHKAPSHIGDHSMIITPDHPDAQLAAQHRDHMHIQIGPTRA
jgi:hypothetical protein